MPTTVLGLTWISRLMAVDVRGPSAMTVRRHMSWGAVMWLMAASCRECRAMDRVMRRSAREDTQVVLLRGRYRYGGFGWRVFSHRY